ncbi:hypothetical protein L3X38_037113 [Prunus dulcis]|uniref:Uncharacterized protein n=1 Tax=Prunus dulcis TaxID=3755 RepID=A0AAD4YQ37_PRUDU|nr:hypothetical protein L3X38_037113 [Prunus dulcis]
MADPSQQKRDKYLETLVEQGIAFEDDRRRKLNILDKFVQDQADAYAYQKQQDKEAQEQKIMFMDVSKFTPRKKKYWGDKQDEIIRGKGVDSETVKGRSSGRGRREAVFVGSGNGIQRGAGMARVRGIFVTDKIQFSGQIVHGVMLRRVAGQGVKDLDGLSFLIGCDVAQFTRQDFCLITGLRFGEVPEVSSGESDEIRLQKRYFIDEGITCNALEEAFLRYPWGSVSFDKTQDSLFYAPTKYVKSFENEEGRGKGKSKVTGTSRRNEKAKKDKHGEAQRGGWSFKGFTYAFQSVQLRALCPSEEEMRQPYWSWPQDRPAVVSAESIPSSCADLDELNKVVSLLRSELFQVKREKDVLELKVIRMEKLLDHCLGPQFEQEVRRDLALLKERTNRYVISHLFKGSEEMDDIQWDEGPSNRNEGEEKEDEGIEGGEGPSNRNEGEEKEEEGIEGGEVQGKPSEVEEAQRKRSEGEQVKIKSSKGEEAQRKSSAGEEVKRKSSKERNYKKKVVRERIRKEKEGRARK